MSGRAKTKGKQTHKGAGGRRAPKHAHLPSDMMTIQPRGFGAKHKVEPQTEAQAAYLNAIEVYPLVFATGPAGTGKTYIAATEAADRFIDGTVRKIIITRPAVGADEEYGFFPGELEEKVAPWAAPVIKILEQRMGKGHVEYLLKTGQIEVCPLGLMRGHTFDDAFVIADEMQNTTPNQMKLFLSRIGENVRIVVDGDLEQKDIQGPSGLEDGMKVMGGHTQVGFVEFTIDDIVRSGLCRDIMVRYAQRKRHAA